MVSMRHYLFFQQLENVRRNSRLVSTCIAHVHILAWRTAYAKENICVGACGKFRAFNR